MSQIQTLSTAQGFGKEMAHSSAMAVDGGNTKPGIEVASLTDVGRQRENNEDSLLYWEPESDEEFRRKGRLAVIADGMGGYEGGQEASRLAVETVRHVYDVAFGEDPQITDPPGTIGKNLGLKKNAPQTTLLHAMAAAHENIQRFASEHPQFHGMGTTCTALSIMGSQLFFAHVGDSRLYLVRPTTITRLTRDHSYVGRLVESGIVREEDAESHPQRHILTAALGSGRDVTPDAPEIPIDLQPGDTLVLCTDGLWSVVPEQDLANLARSNSPAQACSALVNLALQRGGPDNVSVIILRVAA
jgi:serine/threonine protein phosphatase PrpC